MTHFFSDDVRRNPYPLYEQMRNQSPIFHVPPPVDLWMVFDYETVKRVLNDHESFSSSVPAPREWFLFMDPPRHTKLRALISRAFTPKVIATLEGGIRVLSRGLLDTALGNGATGMDLAEAYSVPLPMRIISGMIGVPENEWARFRAWTDGILRLSYSMRGMESDAESASALSGFASVTAEMGVYLEDQIAERRRRPGEDLLSRLVEAEVDGERLSPAEILGFFQLLLVGGQETTTNLINNAILCLLESPEQLARVRGDRSLLPQAIEEVLRYRSPLQWLMRAPRRNVEVGVEVIPAGRLILAMVGSANRDPRQFPAAERFDILRSPNPHLAFGHGIHACLGAALARMEARIALNDLLDRLGDFKLSGSGEWTPRKALHVHGPANLPIQFTGSRAG